jgi:FKBP-type peptidyl-prolyl cis-trans isomerase SlpA
VSGERRIQPGDHVTLHYRLSSMGQEIANTFPDEPETFRVGAGEIDSRLERALTGLVMGTHQTLHLPPWEAFGERDETLIQTLPRSEFPADLPVGHQVEFDLPNGDSWLGTVTEVGAETVEVDFNHPLAGLPVEFEVHILAIDHDQ